MSEDLTENIKTDIREPRVKNGPNWSQGLSTGCTLLNLALSGGPDTGLLKSQYYLMIGDSASGKSWMALNILSEATRNQNFKDYQLVYDNVEDGTLMDIEKYFGKSLKERLRSPKYDKKNKAVNSSTIQEFYYNLDDIDKEEKPYIYVLDSMDSLSSESEEEKFAKSKEAFKKGKEEAGSYGDGKAKENSSKLRLARNKLSKTGSILIIIAQTRDNIGFGAQFNPKTRSGGKALKFYASGELWFSIKGQITKTVLKKVRHIGSNLQIKVKKNRQTGNETTIDIPFYPSLGLDNLESQVDFLIDEKCWKKEGGTITANEVEFEGSKEKLLDHIEEKNLESKLTIAVSERWEAIEEGCAVHRKKKFTE